MAKNTAMNTAKNTICLWYDKDAEAAARFYAETFPDSAVGAVHRAPSDYPSGKEGEVLTVEFTVAGVPCIGQVKNEARPDQLVTFTRRFREALPIENRDLPSAFPRHIPKK